MNWRRPVWWPGNQRKSHQLQEPGVALFQGLRIRLTLWYCGVLGVALLVFGVALYYGTQHFLLPPIEQDAQLHAQANQRLWLVNSVNQACPLLNRPGQIGLPAGQGFQIPEQIVCTDSLTNGQTIRRNHRCRRCAWAYLLLCVARPQSNWEGKPRHVAGW
jgi:hypothetical protein